MRRPSLPATFYWTDEPWGSALRCRPLDAVAPHLFTTRQLALSSHCDWAQVAAALGAERVVMLTQVHGREVVVIRQGAGDQGTGGSGQAGGKAAGDSGVGGRPEADILVSDDPRVAVAVRAADCVPLLIADQKTGVVAAVHAGWRGTAAGAATAAVDALSRECGSKASDLIAAIGPSIGACCYEVGPELVGEFVAAGHARSVVDRWFTFSPGAAKPQLDTWLANRDQLQQAGVRAENIHVAALCTACNLDLFPSFRNEKERAGRIAGAIRARRGAFGRGV